MQEPDTEEEEDEFEETGDNEIRVPERPLVPDAFRPEDLRRPELGSQAAHAARLWEQAAALAALRDALLAAKFDPEESWALTQQYADAWWGAEFEMKVAAAASD